MSTKMYARTKKGGRDLLNDKQVALALRLAARVPNTPGVDGGDFEWAVTLDGRVAELAGNGYGATTLDAWCTNRKRMTLTNTGRKVRVVLNIGGTSVSVLPKVAEKVAGLLLS